MIVETIFNLLFAILENFLDMLPDVSWQVDGSFLEVFFDVLRMVCYLLPMGTVIKIISIIIVVNIFRVVIAFIKSIWDLLPFL